MVSVSDVLAVIDEIAPWGQAFPFDKVGLQVGGPDTEVTHVFVSLDRSLAMLELAAESGAQLILSHHPLIWDPLKRVITSDTVGRSIQLLAKHEMAFAGVHTNWDVAAGGVSETLALKLGLCSLVAFGQTAPGFPEAGSGRLGELAEPMALHDFTKYVDEVLGTKTLAWGDPQALISRVGVVGGAGDSEWVAAKALGADAFLTGEIAQNEALEGFTQGVAMLAAGHYATEQPGCAALRDTLALRFPSIAWTLYEPIPGMDGRPS